MDNRRPLHRAVVSSCFWSCVWRPEELIYTPFTPVSFDHGGVILFIIVNNIRWIILTITHCLSYHTEWATEPEH